MIKVINLKKSDFFNKIMIQLKLIVIKKQFLVSDSAKGVQISWNSNFKKFNMASQLMINSFKYLLGKKNKEFLNILFSIIQ